ncbi:hypothetical protein K7W42_20485 [Deinococcus sp. HMF7604]|uniref:hypothetical protein n=1 Tax=Deinococcus betulae TaxID=2873312 RepID=UPI001CCFF021|nr:hypothetical protein [Deinococcus betulae]MBZ9753218.1 hypothetical protein [Deinococcus betulae]
MTNQFREKALLAAADGVALLTEFHTILPPGKTGMTTDLRLLYLGPGQALLTQVDVTVHGVVYSFPEATLLPSGQEVIVIAPDSLDSWSGRVSNLGPLTERFSPAGTLTLSFHVLTPQGSVRVQASGTGHVHMDGSGRRAQWVFDRPQVTGVEVPPTS